VDAGDSIIGSIVLKTVVHVAQEEGRRQQIVFQDDDSIVLRQELRDPADD